MEKRSKEFWKGMRRFVCIGGQINSSFVSGHRLMQLYGLKPSECVVAEGKEDPRLSPVLWYVPGLELEAYPERYTVLRPVENKPGSKHTAEGYGYPHADIPMNDVLPAMISKLIHEGERDYTGLAVLADALEDAWFNDPRFPWLVEALRDKNQVDFIPSEIFHGVLAKMAIKALTDHSQFVKDQIVAGNYQPPKPLGELHNV